VEDLQSTGDDDSIDRLLVGLDNMNEEGTLGEVDAWAKVYQDLVGDTVSNEENTNILIHDIEGGSRKGSLKKIELKISCIQSGRGTEEKTRLTQGIHVCKVSEKGKVPTRHYCCVSIEIENRGEWYMVKVTKTTADQWWGRIEHHFHFKCAKAKGGLEENDRAVNQLLAIVRSENNIGQDKKG
jgi:hypothetical protein